MNDTHYRLMSTVLHKGPLPNQGHYISMIKKNEYYYQINDHKVETIDNIKTSPMHKSGDSYILMYEKC